MINKYVKCPECEIISTMQHAELLSIEGVQRFVCRFCGNDVEDELKIIPTLDNWLVTGMRTIVGTITNDPRFRKGEAIKTSSIQGDLTEKGSGSIVVSVDSIYLLGKECGKP